MSTKTITQSGCVFYDDCGAKWHPEEPSKHFRFISGARADWKDFGAVVCETTISFEVPADFDPRPAMVESLQAKKRELQAEFTKRVTELDRQISELQALDFTPA